MRDPKTVPVPHLMRHLPRDRRGFPIMPIVLKDDTDVVKFSINSEPERQRMIQQERCGVCGNKLYRARWLVGGPGSAFLPHGAYLDPPMHTECLHYAMKVCPYLAAPRWGQGISDQQRKQVKFDGPVKPVFIGQGKDPIFPNRPDIFVAVQIIGKCEVRPNIDGLPVLDPPRNFRNVEFWIGGEQLSAEEGQAITAAVLEQMIAKLEEVGEPI